MEKIIIGSRGSDLALWQANHVKKQLENLNCEANGASKVSATVKNNLKAEASGVSKIEYASQAYEASSTENELGAVEIKDTLNKTEIKITINRLVLILPRTLECLNIVG